LSKKFKQEVNKATSKVEKVAILVAGATEVEEQQVREGKVLVDPLESWAYRAGKVAECVSKCHGGSLGKFLDKPLAFELGNGLAAMVSSTRPASIDPNSDSIRTNNTCEPFVTTVMLIALMASFVIFACVQKVTFLPDLQQLMSFLAAKAVIFEIPLVGVPHTIPTHLLGHPLLQSYLERHLGPRRVWYYGYLCTACTR
jgi:hypothetical protein